MLLSFIRHVRRQSKTVRNQYALAIAVIFTGAVGSAWLYTNVTSPSEEFVANSETEKSLPFSNLLKQAKEQWATAKEAIQDELPASSTEPIGDSRTLILSEETINEKAKQGSEATSSTTPKTELIQAEIEVQIGTTSSQSTTSSSTLAE